MRVRVAYQGEPGAYSEGASFEAFAPTGQHIEAVGFSSFDEVFNALATGKTDYACVPVENTLGGSIHVNYDLMLRYHGRVHAVGEHSFRVRHALLALPGVTKSDIKQAMSHPQALAQTERYLHQAGIKPMPAYDTAGSAKVVRDQGLRDTAAIASARAAEVHGLEVLDYGIEDDANNFTRFLILGRRGVEIPEGIEAKTSIVFVPKRNEIGVLHKALSCFAQRDIDLSKIESRPFRPGDIQLAKSASASDVVDAPGTKRKRIDDADAAKVGAAHRGPHFEYAFYVDILATATTSHCRNAFRHLEELTRFVKCVGHGAAAAAHRILVAATYHRTARATVRLAAPLTARTCTLVCRVLGTYPLEGLLLPLSDDEEPSTSSAPPVVHAPLISPLRIAVIGFGTFGQFLARRWVRRGHAVFAQSRTDYSELARSIGVTYVPTAAALVEMNPDVVVISVSILSFEFVLKALPSALLRSALIVDVLSVKQYAKETMLVTVPADSDILCLHPMFGPESGKSSWAGLPLVYEQVRVADFHRASRFLSLFEDEGCRMVKMTCEQHDAYAAGSQFVTHLTGRMLSKLKLQPSPIATAGFKALLKLVDNTCSDSFDLFYALYAHNPNSSEQLEQFQTAFDSVRRDLLSANGSAGPSDGCVPISPIVSSMAMSKTVAVADKAAALRQQGKQIVSLSVGEPDILPAPAVLAAAHAALDAGHVKYTENGGAKALRDAICSYLRTAKGLEYAPNQIVCSNGAKQSLMQAMMALCGDGDEVIVPAPYWVSYTQITHLCRAKSVVVRTRATDGYCLMPDDLEAALTPQTRVFILCNPSNPTGAVHPGTLLERLAAVLRKWPKVVILADEIYEQVGAAPLDA